MKWILIIIVLSNTSYKTTSLSTAEFSSKEKCETAVESIVFALDDAGVDIYSSCTLK